MNLGKKISGLIQSYFSFISSTIGGRSDDGGGGLCTPLPCSHLGTHPGVIIQVAKAGQGREGRREEGNRLSCGRFLWARPVTFIPISLARSQLHGHA